MAKIPFDIKYKPQIESGEYKVETENGATAFVMDWGWNNDGEKCLVIKIHANVSDKALLYHFNGKRVSIFPPEEGSNLFIVIPGPELTEFEERVKQLMGSYPNTTRENKGSLNYEVRKAAAELLELARKELKKTFVLLHKDDHQTAFDLGKAEALKDLPKWRKIGRGNNYSSETKFAINGRYLEMNDTLNDVYEVALSDLEKLPRFKED